MRDDDVIESEGEQMAARQASLHEDAQAPITSIRVCRICGSSDHEVDGDEIYDWQEDGYMPSVCRAYKAEKARLSRPILTAAEQAQAAAAALAKEEAAMLGRLGLCRPNRNLSGKEDDYDDGRVLWQSPNFTATEMVDFKTRKPEGYSIRRK